MGGAAQLIRVAVSQFQAADGLLDIPVAHAQADPSVTLKLVVVVFATTTTLQRIRRSLRRNTPTKRRFSASTLLFGTSAAIGITTSSKARCQKGTFGTVF